MRVSLGPVNKSESDFADANREIEQEELEISFSPKQIEYIQNATHRWNFKIGATQCGKTYIDTAFVIYDRMRERRGKPGLTVIVGVNKGTIERNVLTPMRDFWGKQLVGEINSENKCQLFGELVYCLGADKVDRVKVFRGMKIKYLYIDEAVDINGDVFELLKSRLSLAYSICDGTGNPASPTHELKKFIDNPDIDVYAQEWTIFDNPYLPKEYVNALCKEYEGTVYYDRYILGKWQRAEGVIFRKFADNPEKYIIDVAPPIFLIEVGVDFGGNKSKNSFTATGFTQGFRDMVVLENERIDKEVDPNELDRLFTNFATMVYNKYVKSFYTNYDSAEPVLGRGLAAASIKAGCRTIVRHALKISVNQRIRALNGLIGGGRFWVMRHCKHVINALSTAVWNPKSLVDERLDDGTSDIDTLDSLEYSYERYINDLQIGGVFVPLDKKE